MQEQRQKARYRMPVLETTEREANPIEGHDAFLLSMDVPPLRGESVVADQRCAHSWVSNLSPGARATLAQAMFPLQREGSRSTTLSLWTTERLRDGMP